MAANDKERKDYLSFRKFPNEIKSMVFTEALCKPHIHFFRVRRVNNVNQATWSIDLSPFPRNIDSSGFRLSANLSAVDPIAAGASTRAATEPMQLQIRGRTAAAIDAATDIVCVTFDGNSKLRPGYWALGSQIHNRIVDRQGVSARFAGIKKIALSYSKRDKHSDISQAPFICTHRSNCCPWRGNWKVCPEELAGFIDCLPPSVEEIYVIARLGITKAEREQVQTYKDWFFREPVDSIFRDGMVTFYDARRTYIEIDDDTRYLDDCKLIASLYEEIDYVIANTWKYLLADTNPSLTMSANPPQFTMPLAQRERLRFTQLLAVD
ncbi:hypothetical protein B0T17DRAFT_621360 [Bombardia bombarda]|uniref:Uncharacterized protein n=1 Tax=Bombardia bombarda TaxID=252184 RepID=A0AA39TR74_9PEZI|nr:hypothetical protein B0T17DRAFT_621360 [Bombardia bombarda]